MEEKKKSNSSQLVLVVLFLVLVMVFVGYKFLLSPLFEEKKAKQEENTKLETRKIELLNLSTREQEFKLGIEESRKKVNEAMESFGPGNSPEKSIMFVKGIEEAIGMQIVSMTFSEPMVVQEVHLPRITENIDSTYSINYFDVQVLKESLTVEYLCDYEQLKEMNNYINLYGEKMNVNDLSASYDNESGKIEGSFNINLFAAIGGDKEYSDPVIEGIMPHKDNIFSK